MLPYREIVLVDFEFVAQPGERPEPVCLVAKLLRSGRTIRLGAISSTRRRRTRSTPTRCSSPTTPVPNSAAIEFSVGRCRPASSTCARSSVTAPVGSRDLPAPA